MLQHRRPLRHRVAAGCHRGWEALPATWSPSRSAGSPVKAPFLNLREWCMLGRKRRKKKNVFLGIMSEELEFYYL